MSQEGEKRFAERAGSGTSSSSSGTPPSNTGDAIPEPRIVILVDASNAAYGSQAGGDSWSHPRIDNLRQLLGRLGTFPVEVDPLADATLRHKIDRKSELEAMLASGSLKQVPAGTTADDFLWQVWKGYRAKGTRAFILTNDQFPLARAQAESIPENPRITFLFHAGDVYFQPPIESLLSVSSPAILSPTKPESPNPAVPEVRPTGEIQTQPHGELIESAIEVIASLTQPPGGIFRRVNFATVSHDLHQKFGGDFVANFGLGRPKDLAEELEKRGLVTISYTNTTMYVEPTLAFEGRIIGRKFPRRQVWQSSLHEGEAQDRAENPRVVTQSAEPPRTLPEVIEVSSRDLGPTVEIPGLEMFLKLVNDSHPKHVFHWWSQRRNESDNVWLLEGEFFFVSEGTTYKLSGRGYRTLGDFVDGRAKGLKEATDPKVIGDPKDRYAYDRSSRPQLWREILRSRNLDEDEYRPSEGDVYYYVRAQGFPDFAAFLAAERAKPKPPVYV